ncbi:PoNe immunity protein domain-containing protein [Iodobacter arcticus]|uniref:PoNe immunity protein domain-containing protein n=1 Tax=Iodobacter arcticus TaxID=590593 RepID=A0ABW2R2T6_9NEIS
MNASEITKNRRQQFLYPDLYKNCLDFQIKSIQMEYKNVQAVLNDPQRGCGHSDHALYQAYVYHESFWLWMLDYTAGINLDELALRLSGIVDLFDEWFNVEKAYNQRLIKKSPEKNIDPNAAAPDFYNQLNYEDTLQLLSVAIMLRDQSSVQRIIKALKFYRQRDGLFEQLIFDFVDDGLDTFELFHDDPYKLLLQVYFDPEGTEGLGLIQQYLKAWYPAQEGARWYDAHRTIVDDNAPYYGYWAFEAGATAYLLDMDDSQIEHMVYPKDLVTYAKKLRDEGRYTSCEGDAEKPTQYRVVAKQSCTRDGYWYTPAKQNSRALFRSGELMPDFPASTYGATIWYWDANQD